MNIMKSLLLLANIYGRSKEEKLSTRSAGKFWIGLQVSAQLEEPVHYVH